MAKYDEKSGMGGGLSSLTMDMREMQKAINPSGNILEPEGMELDHCQVAPAGAGMCQSGPVESQINYFTTSRWATLALTAVVVAGTGVTVALSSGAGAPRAFLAGQSEAGTSANLSGNLTYADTNAQKGGEFVKAEGSNYRITGVEVIAFPAFEELTISGDPGARAMHKELAPYMPELLAMLFATSIVSAYREGDETNVMLFGRPDFLPSSGGVRGDHLGQVGQLGMVRAFMPLAHPAWGGPPNINNGLVCVWENPRTVRIVETTDAPLAGGYSVKIPITLILRGHPVGTAAGEAPVGDRVGKVATPEEFKAARAVVQSLGMAGTQDEVFTHLRRSGYAVSG